MIGDFPEERAEKGSGKNGRFGIRSAFYYIVSLIVFVLLKRFLLSSMQYLSELEQLLLTAKHPRIRLLLQKALNDASIAQHSEVVAVEGNKSSAEEKDILVPPLQGPVKASTAGMSKITNYGESAKNINMVNRN